MLKGVFYLRSALANALLRRRVQHLKFWPLWLASVAAPMFILAVAAWWLWNLELFEAKSRMERTIDLLREQSLRTFEKSGLLDQVRMDGTMPMAVVNF